MFFGCFCANFTILGFTRAAALEVLAASAGGKTPHYGPPVSPGCEPACNANGT